MRCPSKYDLQSYYDQELNSFQRRRIARHLSRCPACCQKIEEFQQVTALLRETLFPAGLPEVHPKQRYEGFGKAAVAVFVLALGLSGWWYSRNFQSDHQASRDGELLEQYYILHSDEGRDGNNV